MTESKATDKEREAPFAESTDSSDIEGMIALLDDDAAQIRKELAACRPNGEGFIAEEWADNMIRAAGLLRKLAEDNYRVAQLLLDQDREGAKKWARGTLINMDEHGGLTVNVDALSSRDEATADADEALSIAVDALREIALAGMSLPMAACGDDDGSQARRFHADQAWTFIRVAATALEAIRCAITASQRTSTEGKV